MENIPFKTEDTLALWQWLVLIFSCLALVFSAVAAKWYATRKKGVGLLGVLTSVGHTGPLADVQMQQKFLSRQAKIYQLEIDGKTHLIFETDKGLIELNHDEKT